MALLVAVVVVVVVVVAVLSKVGNMARFISESSLESIPMKDACDDTREMLVLVPLLSDGHDACWAVAAASEEDVPPSSVVEPAAVLVATAA